MVIKAANHIRLVLINESHASTIFEMVHKNKENLRQWLSFVDKMESIAFAETFIKGSMQRNDLGTEYAFIIFENEIAVGRVGVYKIDQQHKIGEIGYWLVEEMQGKGIMTCACKAIVAFCFDQLLLNRIEIKCGFHNVKSQALPNVLGFTKEGIIREGEWLHEKYIDLFLYSLLKSEYQSELSDVKSN